MTNRILQGKRGIIFGALDSQSIAWKTAMAVHREGGKFVLTNTPFAMRLGEIQKLAQSVDSKVIEADATNIEDLNQLITQSMKVLGGRLDFILHSIGRSDNVRKKRAYTDINYDSLQKGWDISAVSFHKLLQQLYQLEAMNPWGSIVALSYIAAQRVFPTYSDMAENKAYLESIARSFGYHFGKNKKVRVNTVSQSPTPTTAGKGVQGLDNFLTFADKMSPLGNASADDCAQYIVALFSDYTRLVSLQNLYHDGGFSSMGISDATIDMLDNNDGQTPTIKL